MGKMRGKWTMQYGTVLIIQGINLIKRHLRMKEGNSLVIHEAGHWETDFEVTTLPGMS